MWDVLTVAGMWTLLAYSDAVMWVHYGWDRAHGRRWGADQ